MKASHGCDGAGSTDRPSSTGTAMATSTQGKHAGAVSIHHIRNKVNCVTSKLRFASAQSRINALHIWRMAKSIKQEWKQTHTKKDFVHFSSVCTTLKTEFSFPHLSTSNGGKTVSIRKKECNIFAHKFLSHAEALTMLLLLQTTPDFHSSISCFHHGH